MGPKHPARSLSYRNRSVLPARSGTAVRFLLWQFSSKLKRALLKIEHGACLRWSFPRFLHAWHTLITRRRGGFIAQ